MIGRWMAILSAVVMLAFASASSAAIEHKVKKGENPSSIAKKYGVSVKDLLNRNNIDPKGLRPGTKIVIPVSGESAKRDSKPAGNKAAAARKSYKKSTEVVSQEPDRHESEEASPQSSESDYCTVRKGDTLSSIAKQYSLSASELRELNGLKSSKLRSGQKLLVRRTGPRTYTVRKGDNVWKIAKKFDMDADDLMELNELESPSLKVGMKLYLEEKADPDSAETFRELIAQNNVEEVRKILESGEFAEKDQPDKLITFAKKLVNIPYRFGGTSILGIDCSGYVKKVYGFFGIDLPRTAREQFKNGETIEKDELSIGDLVFFRTYASFPSHVGIYLGNDLFIHASSKDKRVTITSLETPYYLKRFIGGKRILTKEEQEKDPNS